jgi:predicted ester cyclase
MRKIHIYTVLLGLLLAAPLDLTGRSSSDEKSKTIAPPPGAGSASGSQLDRSVQARNKVVAMRVFDEIFNQGKFQVADEIYAPDFQNHGLTRTIDLKTDQDYAHAEKKALPDLRISVQQMVAEGDRVAVLGTIEGTHTGWGYEGLPPTGTRVKIRAITIWRFSDGRIVEEWTSFSEDRAYVAMFAHLKWWLMLAGLLALAIVIAVERLVWRTIRKMFARRGQSKPLARQRHA